MYVWCGMSTLIVVIRDGPNLLSNGFLQPFDWPFRAFTEKASQNYILSKYETIDYIEHLY